MTPAPEFDVFLSYNHRDRDLVLEIWRNLEARGLRSFVDIASLPKGRPWIPRLEEGIRRSRAAVVFVGPHGPGPFQEAEIQLAVVRQWEQQRGAGSFVVIPALLQEADLATFSAFLKLNTFISFQHGITAALLDELAESLRPEYPRGTNAPTSRLEICPYLGLETFREEHARFFFGRESYIDAVAAKIRPGRLVAVVGGSGSGKSSVIHAGVLPRLNAEVGTDHWTILKMTPDAKPFRSLASALLSEMQADISGLGRLDAVEALERRLRDPQAPTFFSWKEIGEELARSGRPAHHTLLFIDQFEELFSLTSVSDRRPFLDTILNALRAQVSVVLTMRADFVGPATAESREFTDIVQQGLMLLGPMRREELARAIVQPARAVGLTVDPVLVERLLNDIGEDMGTLLPLLQFALKELWRKRSGDALTAASYAGIEEFTKAIAARADEEVALLQLPNREEVARRVLCRLVQVSPSSDEGANTRARLPTAALNDDEMQVVLSLSRARLLTTNRDPVSGISTVEVAHEALIRHWARLRTWLEQDHAFLLWRQRFNFFREEWLRMERDSANLLPDSMLREARQYLQGRPLEFDAPEVEYIAASSLVQTSSAWWRRGAAAVAAAAVLALAAWVFWTRTDSYQLRQAYIKGDRAAAAAADISPLAEWLAALASAGQALRIEAMLTGRDKQAGYAVLVAAAERLKAFDAPVPVALYERALGSMSPRDVRPGAHFTDDSERFRQDAIGAILETRGANGLIEVIQRNADLDVRCRLATDAVQSASKPTQSTHAPDLVKFGLNVFAESRAPAAKAQFGCPGLLGALTTLGHANDVLRRLKATVDPQDYETEAWTVAAALAHVGKVDQALALMPKPASAGSVVEQSVRVMVLTADAVMQSRAANVNAGRKRTQEILEAARGVQDRSARDQLLATAVSDLVEVDYRLASVLAHEVGDADVRDELLETVVTKAMAAEDAVEVLRSTQRIKDESRLADLAETLATHKDCGGAFALVDRIRDLDDATDARGDVFVKCAAAGQLEVAVAELSKRTGPLMFLAATSDAPTDLLSEGNDEAAVAVARRRRAMAAALSPKDRFALRVDEDAVAALLNTGHAAEAVDIARHPQSKALIAVLESSLPSAAGGLTSKGRVSDALSLIDLTERPLLQAEAVLAILMAKGAPIAGRDTPSVSTGRSDPALTDGPIRRELITKARRLAAAAEQDQTVPRDRLDQVFAGTATVQGASVSGLFAALELAAKIKDAKLHDRTLVSVLAEAAKAGLVDVAIDNAPAITDSKAQFQVLMHALQAAVTQRNAPAARRAGTEALAFVVTGVESKECGTLSAAFADLGEFRNAVKTADHCENAADRLRGYASIVRFSTIAPPQQRLQPAR